jgi:hypothetical protein
MQDNTVKYRCASKKKNTLSGKMGAGMPNKKEKLYLCLHRGNVFLMYGKGFMHDIEFETYF